MPAARRAPDGQDQLNRQLAEALQKSIGRDHRHPRRRYRDYFTELDLEADCRLTSWHLEDKHLARSREQAVTYVCAILRSRLQERIARLRGGKLPVLEPMDRRFAIPQAEQLSRMQLALIKKRFPAANGGFALDRYEDAFTKFSNGELRWFVTSVQRRAGDAASGYYFLFAEFALSAIESGIDQDAWQSLAPVMVRCQWIAGRVYEFAGFDKARFKGTIAITKTEKNKLAKQHGSSLEALCTAHARNAAEALGVPRAAASPPAESEGAADDKW